MGIVRKCGEQVCKCGEMLGKMSGECGEEVLGECGRYGRYGERCRVNVGKM